MGWRSRNPQPVTWGLLRTQGTLHGSDAAKVCFIHPMFRLFLKSLKPDIATVLSLFSMHFSIGNMGSKKTP